MTTMTIRKDKRAERSCERWPVGCNCPSRQFSIQDFLPRVHLLDAGIGKIGIAKDVEISSQVLKIALL